MNYFLMFVIYIYHQVLTIACVSTVYKASNSTQFIIWTQAFQVNANCRLALSSSNYIYEALQFCNSPFSLKYTTDWS